MKRSKAIKDLTNYLSSVNFDGVNHCGGKDLNELIAKVSIDFLYKKKIMLPLEYQSSGCLHSLRESCDCQGSYSTEWERESSGQNRTRKKD